MSSTTHKGMYNSTNLKLQLSVKVKFLKGACVNGKTSREAGFLLVAVQNLKDYTYRS